MDAATKGAFNDQERLFFLYEFIRNHRYYNDSIFDGDELYDPVKHFNSYCGAECGNIARITTAMAYYAGFSKERNGADPMSRAMHGHVANEVALNGKYQFFDTQGNAFYLDPENELPVSGDEIVFDHDLVSRDYTYGPIFSSREDSERAAAVLGRDDIMERSITVGYEMHLALRPGEKLTLRWDNIGKTPGPRTFKGFSNSFIDYSPMLDKTCFDFAEKTSGVDIHDNYLFGINKNSFITFAVTSPWVICGGYVQGKFTCGADDDSIAVSVSVDGKQWTEVWQRSGKGTNTCEAVLDDALGVKKEVPRYNYYVRISLASENGSSRLEALKLHTDLLASSISLPRLSLGENHIRYSDKTVGQHTVKITHTWQESRNIMPPPKPQLDFPSDTAVISSDSIEFRWNSVPDADKYYLRVSKRADLRIPYRPCFDGIVDSNSFCNPRTGLFSPGDIFYWSVRARSSAGVWGEWSPVRTFSWDGPRPPVDLKTIERDGKLFLTWQSNIRGKQPVHYEVYASDIRGFKPSKTSYTVFSMGEVPTNFAAETTGREFLIVSPDPADKAPNKSYYRVIAIDENGTSSGSSWQLELDHPYIYSKPPLESKEGETYTYSVLTLHSLGDLQFRYQKPNYGFWEREGYLFALTEGPVWLSIDSTTGVLTGKPGIGDIGKTPVTITVTRTFPDEVKKGDTSPEAFSKNKPQFQASDEQSFVLRVSR